LLYLPLDKLMGAASAHAPAVATNTDSAVQPRSPGPAVSNEAPPQLERAPQVERGGSYSSGSTNPRDRDTLRTRDRETR
ncbi:MAG: modulator of FtsH protease HflK, partial [Pseudomonadota bacterium]|nr:modulator of FtsH protease HflK [Pseudomonadota bacterium]